MSFVKITPAPGLIDIGTEYSNEGRWSESNLIRFVDGTVRPIGGWKRLFDETVTGTIIGVFSYSVGDLNIIILGTTTGIYRHDGTLTNITPPGFATPTPGQLTTDGYGCGLYGKGDYGSPFGRDLFKAYDPTAYAYAFATFGTTLIVSCTSDGKIYKLGKDDTVLTQCANSPAGVSWSIVSDERFVFAIAPNGNRSKIQWSDIENYAVWTPEVTNRAGSLTIPDESELSAAVKWKQNLYLFSSSAVYRVSYVGGTLVYGLTKIVNQYDEPYSQNSIIVTPNFICWLNVNGVGVWNGQYSTVQNMVHDYVKRNIVKGYEGYTFGGYNEAYNECWWYFVSTAPATGVQPIPDRYIVWNVTDNTWATGYLSRTAWNMSFALNKPLLSDGTRIYSHETGTLADSENIGDLVPYLKNAMADIGEGDTLMTVDRLITDELVANGKQLEYQLHLSMLPMREQVDTRTYRARSGKIDARFTARQVAMTITGPTDSDWSIGQLRANIIPRGKR